VREKPLLGAALIAAARSGHGQEVCAKWPMMRHLKPLCHSLYGYCPGRSVRGEIISARDPVSEGFRPEPIHHEGRTVRRLRLIDFPMEAAARFALGRADLLPRPGRTRTQEELRKGDLAGR